MRWKVKLGVWCAAAIAVAGLCVWLLVALRQNARLRREAARGRENLHAALATLDTTRDAAGRARADASRLRLTVGELEEERGALARQIRALGVRLRRVQSVSETRLRTIAYLQGRIDTVLVMRADSLALDTLQRLAYTDGHVSLEATLDGGAGTYSARVESVDTLIQVVHRVRRGWWIFSCTKGIRQTIRSSNPHTKIVYQEYIEFEK